MIHPNRKLENQWKILAWDVTMKNNEYAIELATISLTIMQVILRRRLGDKVVVARLA